MAFGLSDLGTKGGLKTDTRARVLNVTQQPVGSLYAAGNTMAAVSGEAYPGGGNPVGSSMVFAYLAAMDMVSKAHADTSGEQRASERTAEDMPLNA